MFNVYEYDNLWMDDKNDFGIQITVKNREEVLNRLEEYIRNNNIKINSKRTVDELLTFIITDGGRIEADKGKNDDLIMSLGVAVSLLHTLVDNSPLEASHNEHRGQQPLEPLTHRILTSDGDWTEEDIQWLMK